MTIVNKIISALLLSLMGTCMLAQDGIVLRGNVKDKETGEFIIGANIVEYDKDNRIISGTITDFNGNYVLNVKNLNATIMFSFIGYESLEEKLAGRSRINAELSADSYEMEEVVITAKGSGDALTGVAERNMATSRVKVDLGESIQEISVSAEEALVGKVTGLDITSFSGDPGSGSAIVIRGLGSLGNANPLIVVDGVPQSVASSTFDFASADQEDIGELVNIAPQDIKSIEVLKDAGSTAQWGSKGADGVLQITTFRGKKGKTRFDYSSKYTLNVQPPPIPMLNGDEYVMIQLEEWHNAEGIYTVPSEIAYDRDFIDFYNYNKNTDWVGAISQNGFINEQFFKLSGGGEKTRYYASLNNHSNRGTTINTGLDRLTTRVNLDYNVSQKMRFSVNFSYTSSSKENNMNVSGSNVRAMAYRKAPNMSIWEFDQDGNPTGEYFNPIQSYQGSGSQYFNPVAVANLSRNDVDENRVRNDFTLNYNIFNWLRFQQLVSFQYLNNKRKQFLPNDAIGADWLDQMVNQAIENNYSKSQIITRSQLFIRPELNADHILTGTVMFETDQYSDEWTDISGRNGPSQTLQDPAANPILNDMFSGQSEVHILGILANMNYVLKDRYGLSANFRSDASSRFGDNNRWGNFPSFGVFWRFSSEPWLQTADFFSEGKISYSYGLAGKQPGGAYDRHAIIREPGTTQYILNPILVQQQVQLSNLRWQTLYSHNLKLDLSFLNDRISFTGEIYQKTTTDLLWKNYKIPKSSGYTTIKWFNCGSVENKGWEMLVNVLAFKRNRTVLNFNFNVSQNINSFLEFPDNFNNERDQNIGNGQYPRRADLGQPVGSFYGFRYQGVWPSDEAVVALNENGEVLLDPNGEAIPLAYKDVYLFQGGDAIYKDINHDGKIDIMDAVYLGDSNPDFIGGFGANFTWRDFRISTQWNYRVGFQIVNEIAINTQSMNGKDNQSNAVLHRWRTQGQDEPGMLPRAFYGHPANNLGSDRYVEDGDFLRLLSLNLSYKLPRKICNQMGINSLSIGTSMRRILTLTNYTGQDPEIPQMIEDPFWFGTDNARTPPSRAYSLNVSVGF